MQQRKEHSELCNECLKGSGGLEQQTGQGMGSEADMQASMGISVPIQRCHIVCSAKPNKEEKKNKGW